MSRGPLHYVPVFEIDPNVPGRMIDGRLCIYTGVVNTDMYEDFLEGTYKTGDLAFAYQPHEEWDRETGKHRGPYGEDSGIGFPCRIIDWADVSKSDTSLKLLVYLETDTSYAIVDRRTEGVVNDEGTEDERADRVGARPLQGQEVPTDQPGRADGSSLAM